jgi:hypothetical protein
MVLVAKGDLCDVLDFTSSVGGTINVVDRDRTGEWSRGDVVYACPLRVHEDTCCSTVQQRSEGDGDTNVRALDLNLNFQGIGTGNDVLVW